MSDRFPAQITIGGDLSEQTLGELRRAIELEGAKADCDDEISVEDYLRAAINAGQSARFYDSEASYGRFEELEQFCQENNLSYQRHSMAWFEYDAEFSCWLPGMAQSRSVPADQSGNNCLVPLEQLENALNDGKTLAEVIAFSRAAMADIPPLREEIALS